MLTKIEGHETSDGILFCRMHKISKSISVTKVRLKWRSVLPLNPDVDQLLVTSANRHTHVNCSNLGWSPIPHYGYEWWTMD